MAGRVEGKVAVITGAAGGQGRAAAQLFAREGAKVVVSDVKTEMGHETVETITAAGGEAIFVATDVADVEAVQELMQHTVGTYGRLDVLYNNAAVGLIGQDNRVTRLPEDVWERVLRINLTSVYLCCKYGIPLMAERGGGSIINTASINGLVGNPGMDAYTASKGAVIALTRSMAVEYARNQIRINAICPGAVYTPMTEEFWEACRERIERSHLTRPGVPEDIAHFALYLASDESAFVTGGIFPIDGGLTAQCGMAIR